MFSRLENGMFTFSPPRVEDWTTDYSIYQTLKTAQEKSILSLKEETIHITNGQMFYNNKGECGIVTDVMTGGLLEVTRILACC